MNKFLYKLSEILLLKIVGRRNISKIANMYQVTGSTKILEEDYGHLLSIRKQLPIDNDDQPVPWYTYPAIDYLKQFDMKDKVVFEWGCGNSSFFFAKRAKYVYSVEDNEEWYSRNFGIKEANQSISFLKDEEYINHICRLEQKFDMIIIDGNHRFECAKLASNYLNVGGIIILDNSDWYKNTAKYLRSLKMTEIDFHGFGPINHYTWTTSLFIGSKFNFVAENDIQPDSPIGGLDNPCD